ncbi:MAG: LysM repeat protein [Candidatus Paceibacteria bacterium]|jgi:LysM repeat protein
MNILDEKIHDFYKWFLIFLFLFVPFFANASIFSLATLFGFTSKNEVYVTDDNSEINSQNLQILQAAVNIDPNPAKGGGDIYIVDGVALLAETGVSGSLVDINERKNDQISIYEVREGDALSQIAEMFDVTVNTIRWANELEGPISPGQTLVILPISGIEHTVKFGGTISDIAKIYDADIKEIALFNGISADASLKKGDKVMVPNAIPLNESKKTSSTKIVKSSGGSSYSGSYMRPIKGGYRTQGIHGYNAVDLAAPVGTPIYAALGGRVIISKSSGWNGGYGNYVVIKHDNGTQTLYSHNSSNIVAVGQRVVQGQVIGYIGSTGRSTGPHVHFEIRGARNPF